jgi:DNA-binding NtrC family response regulator
MTPPDDASDVVKFSTSDESRSRAELRKCRPTVLVVEPDKMLRQSIQIGLGDCGCVVLNAENALEALLTLRCHPTPIDLLVSNTVMPLVNGWTLAIRMQRANPSMKIVLISDYQHIVGESGSAIIQIASEILQRPFSIGGLTTKICELLEIT